MPRTDELFENFHVSPEMLVAANIPLDCGLLVAIEDGRIVIERDEDDRAEDPISEDFYLLCEQFGVSRTTARAILYGMIALG